MSYLLESNGIDFLNVDISKIPAVELRKMKRDLTGTNAFWQKYLTKPFSVRLFALFCHHADTVLSDDKMNVGLEAQALSRNENPLWNGNVLTVGSRDFSFNPVAHNNEVTLKDYNGIVPAMAHMMLRVKDTEIVADMDINNIPTSPLSALMTKKSAATYVSKMSQWLTEKGVTATNDENFAMEVYDAVASASPSDQNALRQVTYDAMGELKIACDNNRVRYSPALDCDVIGCNNITVGTAVRQVPALKIKGYKGQVQFKVEDDSKKKPISAQMLDYVASRFPRKLLTYYGYRGNPDKNQRRLMELLPFLQAGLKVADPKPGFKDWCEVNVESSTVSASVLSGSSEVKSDGSVNYVRMVDWQYDEKESFKKYVAFFGRPAISTKLFELYNVYWYRPSVSGKFIIIPKDMKLVLPSEWSDWKLVKMSSEGEFVAELKRFAAELFVYFLRGSYGTHGKQYAALKYPVRTNAYQKIHIAPTVDDVLDIETGQRVRSQLSMTVASSLDDSDRGTSVTAPIVNTTTISPPALLSSLPIGVVPYHDLLPTDLEVVYYSYQGKPVTNVINDLGEFPLFKVSGAEYVGVGKLGSVIICVSRSQFHQMVDAKITYANVPVVPSLDD